MTIKIVEDKISRKELQELAGEGLEDMVKAVVDVEKGIIAIGGELHADGESIMLDHGSILTHLWGINIYPAKPPEERIEFDSLINIRPRQGNRSRNVENPEVCSKITEIVNKFLD